jgi:polysaccharide pyruvyl transferase WcaK-like protein
VKITIVGWYGERNVGDEAFRDVFEKQFAGHDLKFVQNALAGHEKPDLIIFGGGGVVGGQYLNNLPDGVPRIALGVDMALNGPDYERWHQLYFNHTCLRSKEYVAHAQSCGRAVGYCPDLAFSLPIPVPKPKPIGKMRLGVTLSERLQGSRVEGHIIEALRQAQQDYTLCLLPFYDGKNSDSKMHQDFLGHLPDLVDLGWSASSREHLEKIQSLDAMVTMRFHGTIFATLTGTPFLAISSKGKDSLFCEQEGLHPYHLELNGINTYRILDRIDRFKSEGRRVASKLRSITEANKEKVEVVFKAVRSRFLGGQ